MTGNRYFQAEGSRLPNIINSDLGLDILMKTVIFIRLLGMNIADALTHFTNDVMSIYFRYPG